MGNTRMHLEQVPAKHVAQAHLQVEIGHMHHARHAVQENTRQAMDHCNAPHVHRSPCQPLPNWLSLAFLACMVKCPDTEKRVDLCRESL